MTGDRLLRHAALDRLFHWVTAVSVLTLLGSALLPVLGIDFAWVTIHWISGLVLIGLVVAHVARALVWQDAKSMWIGREDLGDLRDVALWNLRASARAPSKPGKYSVAQKLTHLFFTLLLLIGIGTGALMLTKIDTPWWQRNPYWLAENVWGLIYVTHDLVALCLVSIVMVHVYFALRPEKLFFTRSMVLGWITRREYQEHHDAQRWHL
jgi:formate dehydrogenase subunit gamma